MHENTEPMQVQPPAVDTADTYLGRSGERLEKKCLRIAIDPGHGGANEGCSHNGIYENELNLSLAFMLYHALEESSWQVAAVMTRTDDSTVRAHQRVKIAQDFGADLMWSIHINAYENPRAAGWMPFYRPGDRFGEAVARYMARNAPIGLQRRDKAPVPAEPHGYKGVWNTLTAYRELSCLFLEVAFATNKPNAVLMSDPQGRCDILDAQLAGVRAAIEIFSEGPRDDS